MPGDGGGSGHGGADEVSASAAALAALEVAVAGGGAALTLGELIAVHSDAHATSGFTPLETGIAENVGQSLFFGHVAHLHGAWHHNGANVGRDVLALDVLSCHTQVFQARVGTGADEDGIEG